MSLNDVPLPHLYHFLVAPYVDREWAMCALEEDCVFDDITTNSIIESSEEASADLVLRETGVVSGLAVVPVILEATDADLHFAPEVEDGTSCAAGATLARIRGRTRAILATERLVLNLVGRLTGVATITRAFVDAVAGTGAVICDTRKTTPGLRRLEKYAVRCGGGTLHRLDLSDAALFKDNHLANLPSESWITKLDAAIRTVREGAPWFVEVEVDDLDQLRAVLGLERGLVDIVLLDNMSPDELREAVAIRDGEARDVQLEASGGVNLDTVRSIAETGVDRISVGALTHAARSIDIGMDVAPS